MAINGIEVSNSQELSAEVQAAPAGQGVEFWVERPTEAGLAALISRTKAHEELAAPVPAPTPEPEPEPELQTRPSMRKKFSKTAAQTAAASSPTAASAPETPPSRRAAKAKVMERRRQRSSGGPGAATAAAERVLRTTAATKLQVRARRREPRRCEPPRRCRIVPVAQLFLMVRTCWFAGGVARRCGAERPAGCVALLTPDSQTHTVPWGDLDVHETQSPRPRKSGRPRKSSASAGAVWSDAASTQWPTRARRSRKASAHRPARARNSEHNCRAMLCIACQCVCCSTRRCILWSVDRR